MKPQSKPRLTQHFRDGVLVFAACGFIAGCPSNKPTAVSTDKQAVPAVSAPPVTGNTTPPPAAPTAVTAAPAAKADVVPAATTNPAPTTIPPTAATAATAQPAPPVTSKKTCEVEFFGSVKYNKPLPPGQKFWVYAVQGDCLAKNPHVLGATPVNPEGRFGYEVFSAWGVDLSFCAGLAESAHKPLTVYGKATGKYHAEAEGEVVFRDIEITAKPGPIRTFPIARSAYEELAPSPPK